MVIGGRGKPLPFLLCVLGGLREHKNTMLSFLLFSSLLPFLLEVDHLSALSHMPKPKQQQVDLLSILDDTELTNGDTDAPTGQEASRLYRIDPQILGGRTPKKVVQAALEAVRLYQSSEGRELSNEEKGILCQYVGGGALADLFRVPPPDKWANDAAALRELVSPQDFVKISRSITTAYYTPPTVIGAMYRALIRLGVKPVHNLPLKVLELGCGVGRFIGLSPDEWGNQIEWVAIEQDPIAGGIARLLYPGCVQIDRIEHIYLHPDRLDVHLGNVPYAATHPFDAQLRGWEFGGVHDYCIAKGIHALRPGGIESVLTSIGTLQSSRSQAFREQLAKQVRLIAAIKFPMTALKDGGTDASCDWLIFQKLREGEAGNGEEWVNTIDSPIMNPEKDAPFKMNQVFQLHPEWVLGNWGQDTLYGSPRLAIHPDSDKGDFLDQLEGAIANLPADIYVPPEAPITSKGLGTTTALPEHLKDNPPREYSLIWHNENPWQYRGGELHRYDLGSARKNKRVYWMVQLRNQVKQLIELQRQGCSDAELKEAQANLHRLYDSFTAHYGYLHGLGNAMAFSSDPEYPLVLSIEEWDSEKEVGTKTEIFSQRTIFYAPDVTISTPQDALTKCLAESGEVDLDYISLLLNLPEQEVIAALQAGDRPLIFHEPVTQQWVTRDEYLSGNVTLKLKQAEQAAEEIPNYLLNVTALKAVQPKPLKPGQIYVHIESSWMPNEVRAAFICHLFDIPAEQHSRIKVHGAYRYTVDFGVSISPALQQQYGTSRINASKLVEQAFNQTLPVIYDYHQDGSSTKNRTETRKAVQKQELIKRKFQQWVWGDWARCELLCGIYNKTFNSTVPRTFDGAHLKGNIPNLSVPWQQAIAKPERFYQLNAIWRCIISGNTLLQHPTGAGKTATAIIASQERRRLGLCSKPMLCVPDHLTLQQAGEANRIYPGLKVLIISSALCDTAKKRQEMASRMATGTWDLIVCSHSGMKFLALDPEFIQGCNSELLDAIRVDEEDKIDGSKRKQKGLEQRMENLEAKMEASEAQIKRDKVIRFDQCGIDELWLDESHEFLGLPTHSRMTDVLGVTGGTSDKALDLYHKCRYLASIKGAGKGVYLMTATPIRNILGQSWVNLMYLCPERLKEMGLFLFDQFISNFGLKVSKMEITAGGTMDLKTRLMGWINRPEFRKLWVTVADIVKEEQLNIGKPTPIYRAVEVEATPAQKKFFQDVARRAQACQGKRIKKGEDNLCVITTHVRQGVITIRLLPYSALTFLTPEEKEALKDENDKLQHLIRDTYEYWQDAKSPALCQLIFCDWGTPSSARFPLYQYCKDSWVAMGIPEDQIAFIHDATSDAQRYELFKAFRAGKKRILLGSTPKLATGAQFADQLAVIRRLDCPLRPLDIVQQNGRGIRPGNLNKVVEIVSYITVGEPVITKSEDGKKVKITGISPDAYLYAVNDRKMRMIQDGVYSDDEDLRVIDDLDAVETLDFATLMATAIGDQRYTTKLELENQIRQLEELRQDWQINHARAKHNLEHFPQEIEQSRQKLNHLTVDHRLFTSGDRILKLPNGAVVDKATEIGQAILDAVEGKALPDQTITIGTYAGGTLTANSQKNYFDDNISWNLVLHGKEGYSHKLSDTPLKVYNALNRIIEWVGERIEETQSRIAQMESELTIAHKLAEQPFEDEAKLIQLLEEHAKLSKELGLDGIGEVPDEGEEDEKEADGEVEIVGETPAPAP